MIGCLRLVCKQQEQKKAAIPPTIVMASLNSYEKRVAVLALSARGKTKVEIHRDTGIARTTIDRTLNRGTAKVPKRKRQRPVRTDEAVAAVQEAVDAKQGKVTLHGLAQEFNMPEHTMRTLVHNDLGLNSYKRTLRQALKEADKPKRLAAAKKCLNLLKKKSARFVIVHLDETPFPLGEYMSSDTGYYIAKARGAAPDSTVHYGKERHFANLQVIAAVGLDGQKCPLVFLKD